MGVGKEMEHSAHVWMYRAGNSLRYWRTMYVRLVALGTRETSEDLYVRVYLTMQLRMHGRMATRKRTTFLLVPSSQQPSNAQAGPSNLRCRCYALLRPAAKKGSAMFVSCFIFLWYPLRTAYVVYLTVPSPVFLGQTNALSGTT